ncbi:MAG: serine hydrolase [Propionibacterium sp.]|nr:serine hydrolase [Propionibacterium sp.]
MTSASDTTASEAPGTSRPEDQGITDATNCLGDGPGSPANRTLAPDLALIAADYGVQFQASWFEAGTGTVTVGGLNSLPAWSTAKVPLALAVVQSGQGDALTPWISNALRQSDNNAADLLWQSVGADDPERAQAVTSVLRQTGDETTTVPSSPLYPPFSIFGQTQWSTAAQVDFLIQLPCLTGAEQIITDMANVSDSQRWALGAVPGAVFKGGWGPDGTDGGEIVRQFGWYTDASGNAVPVSVAVHAQSFEAGVAALSALTEALTL